MNIIISHIEVPIKSNNGKDEWQLLTSQIEVNNTLINGNWDNKKIFTRKQMEFRKKVNSKELLQSLIKEAKKQLKNYD